MVVISPPKGIVEIYSTPPRLPAEAYIGFDCLQDGPNLGEPISASIMGNNGGSTAAARLIRVRLWPNE